MTSAAPGSPPAVGIDALLARRLEYRILPGLERMHLALAALGRPDRAFSSVLVLGTNGKGSTAALLAAIFQAHGARVGLYTSPHLVRVEERIAVQGETIATLRLLAHLTALEQFPELSYFEALTCAALVEFAEQGVDVAVLEAGLGGRWDAVNAVDPSISLLTNVGTDHQAWLGTSRAEIAAEKAAALRGHEAIIAAWDDEVEPAIRRAATAPLTLASDWAEVRLRTPGAGSEVGFVVANLSGQARLPLAGNYQLANLALALAGAAASSRHGIIPPLRPEAVEDGIEATRWPGRLQWIEHAGLRLLLDGAHNLEAVTALVRALAALGLSGRLHLLFSCLDDKPLVEMASRLRPHVADVTVVPLASPRATALDTMVSAFPGCSTAASVADALAGLPSDRPTLVTGSLRLVGEVLRLNGA
jgi:dihydrofolate synthase/folylpolyglutamate synthase